MDVRDRIQELCEKKKISFSKLAKAAGLSETTVYDWYNENQRMPTVKVLEDVCLVLEISMSQLFSDIDYKDLSPDQICLLENFEKLSPENKNVILQLAKNLAQSY